MKASELESQIRELGFTFMAHQAMTGSQYITVNGIKYRYADHNQPSHYQCKNYTNVKSYNEILDLAKAENEKRNQLNTTDEFIYNYDNDFFIDNPDYIKN